MAHNTPGVNNLRTPGELRLTRFSGLAEGSVEGVRTLQEHPFPTYTNKQTNCLTMKLQQLSQGGGHTGDSTRSFREQRKEPKINPHKYWQMFFDKSTKAA